MATLYEHVANYRQAMDLLEEAEGELTPEVEALLESVEDGLPAKVDGVAAMIRNLEADAAAFDLEQKLFADKKKKATKSVERLKEYLRSALIVADQKSIKGVRFTVALQANAPTVELLGGVTAEALPFEFRRTKVTHEVDKTALKEALKAGDEAALAVAELRTSSHVRIR